MLLRGTGGKRLRTEAFDSNRFHGMSSGHLKKKADKRRTWRSGPEARANDWFLTALAARHRNLRHELTLLVREDVLVHLMRSVHFITA